MDKRMRASLYSATQGGLEKNLFFAEDAAQPYVDTQSQQDDHVMVEVISASINPIDYKATETPVFGSTIIRKPASPGLDYCGRIKSTGSVIDTLSVGELVYGRLTRPTQYGTLGQYIIVDKEGCIPLPEGLNPDHAATIGIAGESAHRSIVPNVKAGDRVFINGGSGGTGTFGIQIAKLLGCHVTASCSTANIELCHELGADEVIDYTKTDLVAEVMEIGRQDPWNLFVDDVGSPEDLYFNCHEFIVPNGKFISLVSKTDLASVASRTLPAFLGGGKRKHETVFVLLKAHREDLTQLGKWMAEGKIKATIDSTYGLRDAADAYAKLRQGHTKGKIVVRVSAKQ